MRIYIYKTINKVPGGLMVVPLFIGMVIFGTHEPIIVPFMAFTLGQTINLSAVVTAGIPGVVLGVAVVIITGAVCIAADRLLGGTSSVGCANQLFITADRTCCWRHLARNITVKAR
jgi:hypothetical protein